MGGGGGDKEEVKISVDLKHVRCFFLLIFPLESAFMDVIPPAAHVPVFGCYGSVLKAAYSEEAKPFDETSCCMLSAVDK